MSLPPPVLPTSGVTIGLPCVDMVLVIVFFVKVISLCGDYIPGGEEVEEDESLWSFRSGSQEVRVRTGRRLEGCRVEEKRRDSCCESCCGEKLEDEEISSI